jgi:CO/xanthine dehydrogenase FAD-binding subunit
VLAAVDATVVLHGPGGERRVPLTGYYTGYRTSVRLETELITAIEVGPVAGRQWFRKVGTRAAQAISKVVFAGVRAEAPRMAVGSVAPTVVRLTRTEQALAGGAGLDAALAALAGDIHPIDDLRSTADYRRTVTANLVRQFWQETA